MMEITQEPPVQVRPVGRPQNEMVAMDRKLQSMGGVRNVVRGLYRDMPSRQVSDQLHALTGIRVSSKTVLAWLRRWAAEGEEVAA